MKRRIGLPVILAVLCFAGAASAQTAFNGQLTPGVSKRGDVDRALGAPTKQESTTLFDYKPPSGAASLQIYYRPDGVVSYINATFSQAYARNDLVQGLGLPAQTQPKQVLQNRLREYFGAPAYLVFTYVSQQSSSGVVSLRYDSPDAFAAEAPGASPAPVAAAAPVTPNPYALPSAPPAPAPVTPATLSPDLANALLPLSANRAHSFNVKLVFPMSTASSKVGDAVFAQVVSPVGADSPAANGGMLSGLIRSVTCPIPGKSACSLDFSLDFILLNGQSIPVVPTLTNIVNSKGLARADDEGNPVTLGSNWAKALFEANNPAPGSPRGKHDAVIIEINGSGTSVSFASGCALTVGLNSDLGRVPR